MRFLHAEPEVLAKAINETAIRCFEINRTNGFHDNDDYSRQQWAERALLVVSELAEAYESMRDASRTEEEIEALVEEEVADAIIRLLDLSVTYGYSIGDAILAKMAKNEGRPYKHGKRF